MIDDDVVRARIPRLGTITTGRGVEATSRKGGQYARPTKAQTLVFHTDDEEVAAAVHRKLGGELVADSPTWGHDVVTGVREVDLLILPSGFRQDLVLYRAAECLRRCDGRMMSTQAGRPVSAPCVCESEIAQGRDRACKPSTILPAMVELDVERFGVWEVRSNSWGSASNVKGTMVALQMVGALDAVPAVLSMVDRQVRDADRNVRDVVELQVAIARSHRSLTELASEAQQAIGTPALSELPAGDDGARLDLMQDWSDLQGRAHRLGLRQTLVSDWRTMFGSEPKRDLADLSLDELRSWVSLVDGTVSDAEQVIRDEQAEATGSRESAAGPPAGDGPAPEPAAQGAPDGGAGGAVPPPPEDDPWA